MDKIKLSSLLKLLSAFLCAVMFVTADVFAPIKMQSGSGFLFGNFLDRINGSVLVRDETLLERLQVKNVVQCVMRCLNHRSCLSLNYGVDPETGAKQCDLLNWGATGFDKFLVPKKNYFHMRQQVWLTWWTILIYLKCKIFSYKSSLGRRPCIKRVCSLMYNINK